MLLVMQGSWALLLGMLFLQLGNGLQGTLLSVRGELENFSTFEMSVVMSAYFLGFLGASRLVPELIRRVGHVRVFAALASFISAVLILYPLLVNPWVWTGGRVIIGFCFCGVYITAESWLNNSATNENRGQLLSSYMVVQMAQYLSSLPLSLALSLNHDHISYHGVNSFQLSLPQCLYFHTYRTMSLAMGIVSLKILQILLVLATKACEELCVDTSLKMVFLYLFYLVTILRLDQ